MISEHFSLKSVKSLETFCFWFKKPCIKGSIKSAAFNSGSGVPPHKIRSLSVDNLERIFIIMSFR